MGKKKERMTETEWQAGTLAYPMLELLRGKASARKLRLFAVACCRRVEHRLTDDRSRRAVEVAERFADGSGRKAAMLDVQAAAWDALDDICEARGWDSGWYLRRALLAYFPRNAPAVVRWACLAAAVASESADYAARAAEGVANLKELAAHCGLLREVFGNPFRSVSVEPAWLAWNNGTVVRMAQHIYKHRRFDLLPILCDALEEAGCADEQIIEHCRGEQEHVRGCWVIDVLLGKK